MNPLPIILIAIAALFLLFQLYPLFTSLQARGKKIPQLMGVVSESVQKQPHYLLYFWAPQCGMCKGMTQVIKKLIDTHNNLAIVNAAEHPEPAKALGVMGTPALVVIENGVIMNVMLGAKTEKAVVKLLES